MEKCVFDKGKKCSALSVRDCEKCSFRKTERELAEGRDNARKRLETLPDEQYNAIMKKYYGLCRIAEVEA
jgi:C4-type Zn-finger protein